MLRTFQRVAEILYNKIVQMASHGAQARLRKCTQGPVFLVRRAVVGRRSGRIGRLSLGRSAVFSDLQLKAPAGWGEPGSGVVVEGLRLVIPVLTCRNLEHLVI